MALELRLQDRARATKDMDLVLREASSDGGAVRDLLIESLLIDPDKDWFQFTVGRLTVIEPDEAGRTGWRFPVAVLLDARVFANVRLDVVPRIDEITGTERVELPGLLSFAEFPVLEVEVVDPNQHFAEKLHALTRSYGDRPNTRVKDLPDLILLIEDGLPPSKDLALAVTHVFAIRRTHSIPDELPDPPAHWPERYAQLADELDIEPKTLDEATAVLRDFWARTLATNQEETANAQG
jgi:xanthine/CO dehydrogenase XdhC/CoxF family maturation factor